MVNEKLLWPLRSQIAHSDCESAWSSNLATPQLTPASPLKAQLTVEDAGDERVEHGTDLGDIEQVRDLSDSPKIPPVSSQLTPFESSPKVRIQLLNMLLRLLMIMMRRSALASTPHLSPLW